MIKALSIIVFLCVFLYFFIIQVLLYLKVEELKKKNAGAGLKNTFSVREMRKVARSEPYNKDKSIKILFLQERICYIAFILFGIINVFLMRGK